MILLAKQQVNQRFIYKIHSSRLRRSKWNLSLSIPEAIANKELVALSDSTALRFINEGKNIDEKATRIKKQIKDVKKLETSKKNLEKIKDLYIQLYNILFIQDYITVIVDKTKDFDRMNDKKGFYINGIKFKRLLATNGGVKKSTVIYVSDKIYNYLHSRIENGRNPEKKIVPAKLEAYKSLTCSASIPVSDPKGVLVVNDCITSFKDNVILLDDTKTEYPEMIYKEDYDIELVESDGYGLILPELSELWAKELNEKSSEGFIPAGLCIRSSFCKGMVFTFDFLDFADKIANQNYIVKDAWGDDRDIREIQIILTTSMLKLWDSYDSIEHYLRCCKDNKYTFSVTKITPEKLENERNLNYQFIQSYDFTDEDIDELVSPTIQEINDVLGEDYLKSILFLKGVHLSEDSFLHQENDFIKALMIDKKMINDPFIRSKIYNSIKKRIKQAKIGVLKVDGNFSVVSGDPFSLCQSIFNLEVTGLLKREEFYSKYWNDKNIDKVVSYRAPMTCHNNIRILRLKNTNDMQYWYKYMDTVIIFNSWDTTSHALNGLDKDADVLLTTNNPVLLRKTKELPAVICIQKSTEKKVVTEEDLAQSNKDGFGDEIGSITNKITCKIDVASNFSKGTKEYEELQYRIICGQNYQQNAIDKMKGCISKSMPKEWYDYFSAKDTEDRDFNLSILADKKPYFFIYNYPYLMSRYKKYIKNSNRNCMMRFGLSIEELVEKQNKNEDEESFLKYYYKKMPVSISKSTMNRICDKIEQAFDGYINGFRNVDFDYSILMTDYGYNTQKFNSVKKIYDEYVILTKQHSQQNKNKKEDKEDQKIRRNMFIYEFKRRAYEVCSNSEELCNIVVDLCYKNNSSKQFAWDVCGDIMIDNLLAKNNYTFQYPIKDEDGFIEYGGEYYSRFIYKIDSEDEL